MNGCSYPDHETKIPDILRELPASASLRVMAAGLEIFFSLTRNGERPSVATSVAKEGMGASVSIAISLQCGDFQIKKTRLRITARFNE